jgi:hypothetical protein
MDIASRLSWPRKRASDARRPFTCIMTRVEHRVGGSITTVFYTEAWDRSVLGVQPPDSIETARSEARIRGKRVIVAVHKYQLSFDEVVGVTYVYSPNPGMQIDEDDMEDL